MNAKAKSNEPVRVVVSNRKARHLYHLLETFQAGIVLLGTEIKALREGHAHLQDSYVMIERGEAFMIDSHISEYSHKGYAVHDPRRPRKLLLHKREIARLFGKVQEKGLTMVPLRIYFVRGRAKVDVAVARGKTLYDKREDIKNRDMERDLRQEMSHRR